MAETAGTITSTIRKQRDGTCCSSVPPILVSMFLFPSVNIMKAITHRHAQMPSSRCIWMLLIDSTSHPWHHPPSRYFWMLSIDSTSHPWHHLSCFRGSLWDLARWVKPSESQWSASACLHLPSSRITTSMCYHSQISYTVVPSPPPTDVLGYSPSL